MMCIKKIIYVLLAVTLLSGNSCDPQSQQSAQRHLDQAFSYIGSMQGTSDIDLRSKLGKNAEIELTKALEYQPDNFIALMNRGVLYVSMGKLNKAESDYGKALAIKPLDSDLNFNLACLYALTDRQDLALDALQKSLEQGFDDISRLREDPDLQALRSLEEFTEILESNKFFL